MNNPKNIIFFAIIKTILFHSLLIMYLSCLFSFFRVSTLSMVIYFWAFFPMVNYCRNIKHIKSKSEFFIGVNTLWRTFTPLFMIASVVLASITLLTYYNPIKPFAIILFFTLSAWNFIFIVACSMATGIIACAIFKNFTNRKKITDESRN
jgi:hypothetical protein